MFNDDGLGAAMGLSLAQEQAAQANSKAGALELRVAELESAVRYLMRVDGENLARINAAPQAASPPSL